jgi:hypothetical protein
VEDDGSSSPGLPVTGSDKALDKSAREWENIESRKAYKTGFQEGIALFNKKPKKGIAYMQQQGMLGTSIEDIALFLRRTKGLNKTLIGDYLGERDDTCIKVTQAPLPSPVRAAAVLVHPSHTLGAYYQCICAFICFIFTPHAFAICAPSRVEQTS